MKKVDNSICKRQSREFFGFRKRIDDNGEKITKAKKFCEIPLCG
jgi:hypothetical protein